jgi:C-terminal processing protease CtpA/Prc
MSSTRILILLYWSFCFLVYPTDLPTYCANRSSVQERAVETNPPKTPLVNPGFEDGEVGQMPSGWSVQPLSQQNGFAAALTDEQPKSGRYCLVFKSRVGAFTPTPGALDQSIDAAAFRNKRVRLRAAVRTSVTGPGAKAQLWLRVDRQNRDNRTVRGFFDDMSDRPILAREWAYYEIIGDVEEDAERLVLGLRFYGAGKVWMDDVSLEIVGAAEKRVEEAARPLTARGLENITTFARLLGYVRHFHPSDEAAKTYWDAFAIEGMRAAEGAKNSAELAQKLEALFHPIAPTVHVFTADRGPTNQKSDETKPSAPAATDNLKVVAWRHLGFGGGTNFLYNSNRVSKSVAEARADEQMPNPDEPFQADLGGGLAARIPLALYADEQGTLPKAHAEPKDSAPQPTAIRFSANDRATRLGAVALAWNVFQHFYPYFDVAQTDWNAALKETLQRAATDPDARAFGQTLKRLVAALRDGHGRVYQQDDDPQFIPAVAWDWVEGRLVVTQVRDSAQGVAPGDVVLTIEGKPVAQALAEREALISGATPQWIRFRALVELAAGTKYEPVTFEIEPFTAPARRVKVTVKRDTSFDFFNEQRRDKFSELEPGIFYLNLDQITDADFNQALPKLEQAKGIIFDLRGYPRLNNPNNFFSRLSDKPLTSAQWLIPEISRPDRQQMKFRKSNWQIAPSAPFLRAKKAFITDGRAISYAESCLGIVEYYKLAEIVGAPTAGTNGNVNFFQLPGGFRVVWTGMKVLKHDGSRHHGVGILPTAPVARSRAAIAAGRDELLERALEIVKNTGK